MITITYYNPEKFFFNELYSAETIISTFCAIEGIIFNFTKGSSFILWLQVVGYFVAYTSIEETIKQRFAEQTDILRY